LNHEAQNLLFNSNIYSFHAFTLQFDFASAATSYPNPRKMSSDQKNQHKNNAIPGAESRLLAKKTEVSIFLIPTVVSPKADLHHSSTNFTKIFYVKVGKKTYGVPKHLIVGKSKYFESFAACYFDKQSRGLAEPVLLGTSERVFERYLYWLQTGKLVIRDEHYYAFNVGKQFIQQEIMVDLYALGNFLMDVKFCVLVLDLLILTVRSLGINADFINRAWEVTLSKSPLRTVVLQLSIAEDCRHSLIPYTAAGWLPNEFIAEALSMATSRMVPGEVADSPSKVVLRAMI
jgi:hypothetical protein